MGEDRERLPAGVLDRELEPAGFAGWTGSGLPDPAESRAAREIEHARAEVEAAREEVERTSRRAEEAEAAIQRAVETADAARAKAEDAKAALDESSDRLTRYLSS